MDRFPSLLRLLAHGLLLRPAPEADLPLQHLSFSSIYVSLFRLRDIDDQRSSRPSEVWRGLDGLHLCQAGVSAPPGAPPRSFHWGESDRIYF